MTAANWTYAGKVFTDWVSALSPGTQLNKANLDVNGNAVNEVLGVLGDKTKLLAGGTEITSTIGLLNIKANTTGGLVFKSSGGTTLGSLSDAGILSLTRIVRPLADAVTGISFQDLMGTTNVLNMDTTNMRVGIKNAAPTVELDVTGAGKFSSNLSLVGAANILSVISSGTPVARVEIENSVSTATLDDMNYWMRISGGGGSTGQYQKIGMGYISGFTGESPVVFGSRTVAQSGATTAAFFIATRNTAGSGDAPTERFTINPDGTTNILDNLILSRIVRPDGDAVDAITFQDVGGTTNILDIDTTNMRVGIGTAAPTRRLTVSSTAPLAANNYDVALFQNGDATGIRIYDSGDATNLALGVDSGAARVSSTGTLTLATNATTNEEAYSAGTAAITITAAQAVTCTAALTAVGAYTTDVVSLTPKAAYIGSGGEIGYTSSLLVNKANVEDMPDISWIDKLKPKTFEYRKRTADGKYLKGGVDTPETDGIRSYGLIAEDVYDVQPGMAYVSPAGVLEGVAYERLVPVLLKAVIDLRAEVKTLKRRIAG